MRVFLYFPTVFLFLTSVKCQGGEDRIIWVDPSPGKPIDVDETRTIGRVVFRLIATDSENPSSQMEYGISSSSNFVDMVQENAFFFINKTTGDATVINPIDYEGLTRLSNGQTIDYIRVTFLARIKDANLPGKKNELDIIFKNLNDEPPRFVITGNAYSAAVTENQTVVAGGERLIANITVIDVDGIVDRKALGLDYVEVNITSCKLNSEFNRTCLSWFELRNAELPFRVERRRLDLYMVKNKDIDYEYAEVIQLTLTANDGIQRTNTDVFISVNDFQDVGPKWIIFTKSNVAIDGTDAGDFRVLMFAEDQDSAKIRRNVSYAFLPGQQNQGISIDSIWEIGFYDGIVTNKVPIDLASDNFNVNSRFLTRWSIFIQACELLTPTMPSTDPDDCSEVREMNITITDINDNRPLFSFGPYQYRIKENILNGAPIDNPRIIVRDADTEAFNKFTVSFVQQSREFILIGANSTPIITVLDTTLIDYDTMPEPKEYYLTLLAVDQLDTSLRDTADVIIEVEDVNDNSPVFGIQNYFGSISERAIDNTAINISQPINATDIDSLLFGTSGIRYSLFGFGAELFTINQDTGVVRVARCPLQTPGEAPCLDYETKRQYDFVVIAKDNGDKPGNTGTAQLTIQVINVNDNVPTVPSYNVSIIEGQRTFPSPLVIQGSDLDDNQLQYSIRPSPEAQIWQINPISGEILLNKPNGQPIYYNDSTNGLIVLTVDVTDGINFANPPSTVRIKVSDINNNVPLFFPSIYRRSIPETTPGGQFILTVTASDLDDPTTVNGQFEFIILGGASPGEGALGRFDIDQFSGNISTTTSATFVAEDKSLYTFSVQVSDKGVPSLSSTARVEITILDVNNKAPFIKPSLQSFVMKETALIGSRVGFVEFEDPDDNPNLVFRFIEPRESLNNRYFPTDPNLYDFRNAFRVNPLTGELQVNGKLNHSIAAVISYGIEIEDLNAVNGTVQKGQGTVVFYVEKVNRGGPVFINPPQNITIREELPFGTVIVTLNARDEDGIDEFSLPPALQGIIPPLFAISRTGSVQVIRRIDYDDMRRLNQTYFVVNVNDLPEDSITTTLNVTVFFENINDNVPVFVKSRTDLTPTLFYSVSIPENSQDGFPVIDVYAIDGDRVEPGNRFYEVQYFMNDDRFDVDIITGAITVRLRNNATLDREINPLLSTQVVARDNPGGTPQNNRDARIQIRLTDENDNPPVFTRLIYRATIYDTIEVGSSFLQLFITDLDTGDFRRSIFRKKANGTDFFDVNRELGSVFVAKSLDGFPGFYEFQVEAIDNLGRDPSNIAEATVQIEVIRQRNEIPIWIIPPLANMTINVLEEQYNGMLVYDVLAEDRDTGLNGIVEYSFVYKGATTQHTPEFTINRITGVIHANIIFDRETVNRYVLLLKATDKGEQRLEATRFLTINVKDVNDNRPIFALNEADFEVNEDVGIGFLVGAVQATDRDLNPVIYYRIISGNEDGVFRVDELTGQIFTLKPLDTELKSVYYLNILATNNEPDYTVIRNRRKRATDPSIIRVRIRVGDINDLAPVFLDDNYYGCISTRSEYGKSILTIRAVDRDAVGTSIVKYSINNTRGGIGNIDNSNYFAIDEDFGIITNTILMRSQADVTFDLTVQARDGIDPATSESSNTNVKIFVTQPGKEVKLVITQNTAEVRLYQSQIQRIVEQSANIDYLCIVDIQDHVVDSVGATSTLWSDVYVSGVQVRDDGSNRILGSRELMNIIDFERTSREDDFDLLYIKDVETASSTDELDLDDKAVIIILVIIAVLIFLVIIFCIVAFMCIKAAKTQKKRILVHKTNSPPPPAPVIMAVQEPEPEPIIYDNRGYIEEVEPPVIQEQEIISPEPVHVQYAVVQKRAPSPVVYETEYRTSDPVDDDQVIIVPLDDGEPQQVSVYETQPVEPEGEYRIETEVVQE